MCLLRQRSTTNRYMAKKLKKTFKNCRMVEQNRTENEYNPGKEKKNFFNVFYGAKMELFLSIKGMFYLDNTLYVFENSLFKFVLTELPSPVSE